MRSTPVVGGWPPEHTHKHTFTDYSNEAEHQSGKAHHVGNKIFAFFALNWKIPSVTKEIQVVGLETRIATATNKIQVVDPETRFSVAALEIQVVGPETSFPIANMKILQWVEQFSFFPHWVKEIVYPLGHRISAPTGG